MVLADSHRISRAPWYSGYPAALLEFRLQGFHPLWSCFPDHSAICSADRRVAGPTTPVATETLTGLGCSRFARHYSGNHYCFLFLQVLRCFSSPGWPPSPMYSVTVTGLQPAGLSHSEIPGSMAVSASPWLIAGYHVLHRLLVPRHPPYALSNFS